MAGRRCRLAGRHRRQAVFFVVRCHKAAIGAQVFEFTVVVVDVVVVVDIVLVDTVVVVVVVNVVVVALLVVTDHNVISCGQ